MREGYPFSSRSYIMGYERSDFPWISCRRKGLPGREVEKKAIVVVALERFEPKGFGRVRMQRVSDVSAESLIGFICHEIKPGSIIRTEGWSGYEGLEDYGYIRNKIVLSSSGDPAHVALPGIHRIASMLKCWLLGIHQGAVSKKHPDYYLNEYTFRFNRRTSKARGLLFYRLLQNVVKVGPSTHGDLSAGEQDRGRKTKKINES